MIKLVSTKSISKQEWLRYRLQGIGGSDVAAALGKSRWGTPIQIYLLKTGQEDYPDLSTVEAVEWGEKMEDLIAQKYMEKNKVDVKRLNFIICHDKHKFMIANIDREIPRNKDGLCGILECKTHNAYTGFKEWKDGEIPIEYLYQGFHYLAVTGYDYLDYAVLIGGNHYIECRIEKDEEIINQLIKDESEFWQRVINKKPPLVDGSAASDKYIKSKYPSHIEGETINLDQDLYYEPLIKRRDMIIERDKLNLNIKEVENLIKDEMKEAEIAECNDVYIVWKKDSDSEMIDLKRLREEAPEVFEQFKKIRKGARKFKVKFVEVME